MNKSSITERLRNKSKETEVNYSILQAFFFYEEFLKLLSQSSYKENFILKGGLLVSAMAGITNRATMDMDFLMNGQPMEESALEHIIQDIIFTQDKTTLYFEFTKIEPIRETDDYGGFRIHLCGRLSNIRQPFYIDIATGDPVTPEAEQFEYQTLFNETISIKSYPVETILAEKIQTILVRADANGRSKDFYDVYILMKLKSSEIRPEVFSQAVKKTFAYRKTKAFSKEESFHILNLIQNDDGCNKRWTQYVNKNQYASGIQFQEVLQVCRQLLEIFYK